MSTKNDEWKYTTTYDHEALVEEHLRTKAYYIAEKDGFKNTMINYWNQAKIYINSVTP